MFNQKFAFTFFWQEVFPDYNTFKEFTDNLELYKTTEPIDTVSEELNKFIYGILSRQFYNNNIRYDDVEAFKMAFASAYINNFNLIKKRKNLLEAQYQLTNEDLEIISKNIINSSYNPNNALTNPLEPIDYVSAQNYTVGKINKLNAYISALNNLQDLDIDFIIKKFEYLFVQILPESDNVIFYKN